MSVFRCPICNERVKVANSMCQKCRTYLRQKDKTIYKPDPTLGKQDFDYKSRPICKICGKAFDNLGNHVYPAHKITINEYKIKFDLPSGMHLSSKERLKKLSARPIPKSILTQNVRRVSPKGKKKRLTTEQRRKLAENMCEVARKRWHGSS